MSKLLGRITSAFAATLVACSSSQDGGGFAIPTDGDDPPVATANQASCACGGNYGSALTSYNGTTFYSNGSCTGTSCGNWQCVEAVERYFGHTDWIGNGNSFCDTSKARRSNLIFFPNGAPGLDGDIIGFNGPSCGGGAGHTGIRCATPSSSTWRLCDQNRTQYASKDPIDLSRTGESLASFSASCTLCGYMRPGWDFDAQYGLGTGSYGWQLTNMTFVSADATAVKLNPGDSDPQLKSPAGLNLNPNSAAGGYDKIRVRLRKYANNSTLRVYFVTSTYPTWSEIQAESTNIPVTGAWTEAVVNLGVNGYWRYGGRVSQIRIDPVQAGNPGSTTDTIEIDWVRMER